MTDTTSEETIEARGSAPTTKPGPQLLKLAPPLLASSLVTYVVSVNDTVLLGRSGAAAVAAGSAAAGPVLTAALFLSGFSVAVQILVARSVGSGDDAIAARTAATAGRLVTLLGLGIAAALALTATPLLAMVADGPGFDLDTAARYMQTLTIGLPVGAAAGVIRGYALGVGRSRVVLVASAASAATDIALALLLLVLGFGPMGVAVATVAGSIAALTVLVGWLARSRLTLTVGDLARPAPARSGHYGHVWRVGWPEGVRGAANVGSAVVVIVLLAPAGAVAIAANRSVAVPVLLAWAILYGFGTAVTTVAGQSLGAGDTAQYAATKRAAIRIVAPIAAGVIIACAPLAPRVAALLVSDPQAVDAATSVAPLAWAQVGWMAAIVVVSGLLRAHGDTRGPLWASLGAEYAVFLPLGWLLTRTAALGLLGVHLAHHVFWLTFTTALVLRLRHRERPGHGQLISRLKRVPAIALLRSIGAWVDGSDRRWQRPGGIEKEGDGAVEHL